MVQGAVGSVEEQFAQEQGVGEIGDEFARGWVGGRDGEEGVLEVCGIVEGYVEGGGEEVCGEDAAEAVGYGGPAGLAAGGLEFVFVGEGWEG